MFSLKAPRQCWTPACLMQFTVESAALSSLAYANATDYVSGVDENNVTTYSHPDYEEIIFYEDEPDQAILAKKNDRCYFSFRGSTADIDDWLQNIGLGSQDIYKDNDNTMESCSAREGFVDFLSSSLLTQATADLQECVSSCSDPSDCIVLTGHSQGGAIAQIISILLYSLNPLVITFGGPLALSRDCDLIKSENHYRYVNSVYLVEEGEDNYIAYDPVPLFPSFGQGRGHYGYYLLLGDDTTALKFLGVDDDDSGFTPGAQVSFVPHSMGAANGPFSYESRIVALYENGVFPVPFQGFTGGTKCDVDNSLTCSSGDCPDIEVGCAEPQITPSVEPPTTATDAASPSMAPGTILADLSLATYEYAENLNEGPEAAEVLSLAQQEDDINGVMALENGKVVIEYADDDFRVDQQFAIWSGTKSWIALLFGIMEGDGLISVNETLWDIWPNETIWENVKDSELRKKTTIESILQMRAGLKMPLGWFVRDFFPLGKGKLGGENFTDSLNYHDIDPEQIGSYSYVVAGNLFSYVIIERTGMTPEEFAAERVFSRLGISEKEYRWRQNRDGVSYGWHGLFLTMTAHSKLGMLYLQGGRINEIERLVEQSWIDRTFTVGDTQAETPFGYLWWIEPNLPNTFCSKGLAGQRMCINTVSKRVIVVAGENYDEDVTAIYEGDEASPQIILVDLFLGMTTEQMSSLESFFDKLDSISRQSSTSSSQDSSRPSSTARQSLLIGLTVYALFILSVLVSCS